METKEKFCSRGSDRFDLLLFMYSVRGFRKMYHWGELEGCLFEFLRGSFSYFRELFLLSASVGVFFCVDF